MSLVYLQKGMRKPFQFNCIYMTKYICGKQLVFNLVYCFIFSSKYRQPYLLHFEDNIKHFIVTTSKNVNANIILMLARYI